MRLRLHLITSLLALVGCLALLVADDDGPDCAEPINGFYHYSSTCAAGASGVVWLEHQNTSVASGSGAIEIIKVEPDPSTCTEQAPVATLAFEPAGPLGSNSFHCAGWKNTPRETQSLACKRPGGGATCELKLEYLGASSEDLTRCQSMAGFERVVAFVPEASCEAIGAGRLKIVVPAQADPPTSNGTASLPSGNAGMASMLYSVSYDRSQCSLGQGVGAPSLITVELGISLGVHGDVRYRCAATAEAWQGSSVRCDKHIDNTYSGDCRLTLEPVD